MYEWEKNVITVGTEIERTKERNFEIMQAIELVKKDPSIKEKIESSISVKKKTSKQLYTEAAKIDKERAEIIQVKKDLDA